MLSWCFPRCTSHRLLPWDALQNGTSLASKFWDAGYQGFPPGRSFMHFSFLQVCRKAPYLTFVGSSISQAYMNRKPPLFLSIGSLTSKRTVLWDTVWETLHTQVPRDCWHLCCASLGQLAGYHSVLGLQFNLQSIHGTSQFNDLLLTALLLVRARHHFLIQLLHLKHKDCVHYRRKHDLE